MLDRDTSLAARSAGYADETKCIRCGQLTHSVAAVCMRCVDAQYVLDHIEHAADVLARNSLLTVTITLARDRNRKRHLVSFVTHRLSWCGTLVPEPKSKRIRATAGNFPLDLCPECLKAFEEALEKSKCRPISKPHD